jgi:hypothetical protein
MSKPRTLSLLSLPFDRLIDLFVTRLFIKHEVSCKMISKLKPSARRNDDYGSH